MSKTGGGREGPIAASARSDERTRFKTDVVEYDGFARTGSRGALGGGPGLGSGRKNLPSRKFVGYVSYLNGSEEKNPPSRRGRLDEDASVGQRARARLR